MDCAWPVAYEGGFRFDHKSAVILASPHRRLSATIRLISFKEHLDDDLDEDDAPAGTRLIYLPGIIKAFRDRFTTYTRMILILTF